jgi:hypothetical protein
MRLGIAGAAVHLRALSPLAHAARAAKSFAVTAAMSQRLSKSFWLAVMVSTAIGPILLVTNSIRRPSIC